MLFGLLFSIGLPVLIAVIQSYRVLDYQKSQEHRIHIVGDSHGYIFHDYPNSNFFVQKGMTLVCSKAKIEMLTNENVIQKNDSLFLVVGAHNFPENLVEKRTGVEPVAKTRFQFFESRFSTLWSCNTIVLGLKNIKLLLKGLELSDEIHDRPSGNRCGKFPKNETHGHFLFKSGAVAERFDQVELRAFNSIGDFCTHNQIKLFVIPVPVPEEYVNLTPDRIWSEYDILMRQLLPLHLQLTMSCQYFFDGDHMNNSGENLFLGSFNPNDYQLTNH